MTSPNIPTKKAPEQYISLLPPENEIVSHRQIITTYCENGTFPDGLFEYTAPLMHRRESRNCHLIESGRLLVLNGGRYRKKDTDGNWISLPVDTKHIYAPVVVNRFGERQEMGGVTMVDPDGSVKKFPGDEPLGAFWSQSLQNKIVCTQQASRVAHLFGINVVIPEYTSAVEFIEDGKKVAAGTYTVPFFQDYDSFCLANESKAFDARYLLFTAIGQFYKAGYIHPQLHAGNLGIYQTNKEDILPVILDWEDAYDVADYRSDLLVNAGFNTEGEDILVTPREKAEMISLIHALRSTFDRLMFTNATSQEELHNQIITEYVSPILLGFLGATKADNVNLPVLQEMFVKASETSMFGQKFDINRIIQEFVFYWDMARRAEEIKADHQQEISSLQGPIINSYLGFHLGLSISMAVGLILTKRQALPTQ